MIKLFSLLFLTLVIAADSYSQHCAPIDKTIITEISTIRLENSLNFQFEFVKNGGQIKKAYQIYFIGYLDKNKEKVFEEEEKGDLNQRHLVNVFDKSSCIIIKKDIIKLADRYDHNDTASIYSYSTNIEFENLSRAMIDHTGFKESEGFLGEFRIVVFIPFLDAKEFSDDLRLQEYTHECNYERSSALIFQSLPYRFEIYLRDEYEKKLGDYYIAPRRIEKGGK